LSRKQTEEDQHDKIGLFSSRLGVCDSGCCTDAYYPQLPSGATAQPTENTAHPQILATIPPKSMTGTEWYKQNVYDPQDNKIGEIMDVLMDKDGKATAFIIGVGVLLGAGEKDVAVPFHAVELKTTKDNKNHCNECDQGSAEERQGIQV
jgi:hypothetical protein